MARTEILHDDASLRLGVCKNLVIPVWSDTPNVTHIRALGRAIQGACNRYRQDIGVFDLVAAGTPNFSDEVRNELVKIVRDPHLQGRGTAHVIMLPGLPGIATRAFLSTVFLLARSVTPTKVFADARAASAWLVPLLSQGGREAWTVEEMLAAVAELTRKVAAAS
jgi:hypothetical protein